MALPTPSNPATDLDASEARQARPGVPVLWVLTISTVVALVAVIVIWAAFSHQFAKSSPPQVNSVAQARRFDTPTIPATTPAKPGTP